MNFDAAFLNAPALAALVLVLIGGSAMWLWTRRFRAKSMEPDGVSDQIRRLQENEQRSDIRREQRRVAFLLDALRTEADRMREIAERIERDDAPVGPEKPRRRAVR